MATETPGVRAGKVALLEIVALIVGFLAGFVLQYSRTSDYSNLKTEHQLSQLRNELVYAHMEVLSNNFGQADGYVTKFFNDVRAVVATTKDEQIKSKLWPLLQRRNEITTALKTANPAAEKLIRELLVETFHLTAKT